MKTVLVTGARGFIGKNLVTALQRRQDVQVISIDIDNVREELEDALQISDVVYHLAGVNRPETEDEFQSVNTDLTRKVVDVLEQYGRKPTIVLTSSIQAEFDNPYGRSKKAAEDVLIDYHARTAGAVCIYRLPNVFGKWSQPNYNTVVATLCHNITRGLDITISDPNRELELVYIDDVVAAFMQHLDNSSDPVQQRYTVARTFRVTLSGLAERIRQLHNIRQSLIVPNLQDEFMQCLHATYLSFLPEDKFAYTVEDEAISDELQGAIHGAGAFRCFKDRVHRRGIEDQWYAFRDRCYRRLAIDWCQANRIEREPEDGSRT